MAYDLFYRTQIPLNCSRNPDAGPMFNKPTAALAAAGLVIVVRGLFGKVQLEREKRRYQRELRPRTPPYRRSAHRAHARNDAVWGQRVPNVGEANHDRSDTSSNRRA